MARLTNIQVHYRDADGTRGVINYLTGDNAEVNGAPEAKQRPLRDALMEKAKTFASEWGKVYPGDQFFAVEV